MRYYELTEASDRSHADDLDAIIAALRANPLSSCFKIFGSATTDKALPGDIDCFAEGPWPIQGDARQIAFDEYLSLASSYYGVFDPFIVIKKRVGEKLVDVLYSRTDDGIGWMVAKGAKRIISDGRAGIPLDRFTKKFGASIVEDRGPAEATQPTPSPQQLDAAIKMVSKKHYGFGGNCAAFAIVLRDLLGGGTFLCADSGDHYELVDHVALSWGGAIFDGSGMITRDQLMDWAEPSDYDEDDEDSEPGQIIEMDDPGAVLKLVDNDGSAPYLNTDSLRADLAGALRTML